MKPVYLHKVNASMVADIKNLETEFAEMAEKGWMIDKVGVFTHRYRREEPCRKRFFVDLLPQITMFDYPGNADAREYRRLCEDSGWTFVLANVRFHVFSSDIDNPAPIPIHTDNSIHAKIYRKLSFKNDLLPWLAVFPMLFLLKFFELLEDGVTKMFLSDLSFFSNVGFVVFASISLWHVGFAISWRIRAKKSEKFNLPLPAVNRRLAKLRNGFMVFALVFLLVCSVTGLILEVDGAAPGHVLPVALTVALPVALPVGTGLWIRRQIGTKERTRKANKRLFVGAMLTMEIAMFIILVSVTGYFVSSERPGKPSHEGHPALVLSDVGATGPARNSTLRVYGSLFVPDNYSCFEINEEGSVSTHVYRAVNPNIARLLYRHFIKVEDRRFEDYGYTEPLSLTAGEAAMWGAEEGVAKKPEAGGQVELLLICGDTILEISASGDNMKIENVMEKAGGILGRRGTAHADSRGSALCA